MSAFSISDLAILNGRLGIAPLPGRGGDYAGDLAGLLAWRPDVVVTMTESHEMDAKGASGLGPALGAAGVTWLHLPLVDFGAPDAAFDRAWPEASRRCLDVLEAGGRVLVHCHGGCGRSGMVCLRLMIEAGEAMPEALARLRAVRACAVETDGQMAWAMWE